MDLEDVLLTLTPPAMGAVLAVGVVMGVLFYADRRAQSGYVFTAAMLGMVFTLTMATVRLTTGAAEWERWLGIGVLGLIYTAGIATGSWARKRLLRSRRRRDRR